MKKKSCKQRTANARCSRRTFLKYAGAAAGLFLTGCGDNKKAGLYINPASPAGNAPPAPGATLSRVVAVKDDKVTTWDGKQAWYGSDSFVNQAHIDQMIKEGVFSLTGQQTEPAAWSQIIPQYGKGKKIAIKINANNAISGGNAIDPLPQLLKALAGGLKAGGIDESDIWFLEPSRPVVERIAKPVKAAYPGVTFYCASQTDYTSACTYDSKDPSLAIEHRHAGISTSKLPDQLGSSSYLIHMPIMKAHGMAGITLTYKNLFGLFESSTIPKFHKSFFYASNNPMVEIYANRNIAGKTVLILADGIYGNWVNNHTAPAAWVNAFKQERWPKRIFLSKDPVALDSVLYDFLNWEKKNLSVRDETYIAQAAKAKQGARDHWNNPTDKKYSLIDFVQREINS